MTHSFPVEYIGSLAGLLTTISFVPQVLKVVRHRETGGISLRMYVAFVLGVILWTIYGFLIGSASIVASNLVTAALAGIVLSMKIRIDYFHKRK